MSLKTVCRTSTASRQEKAITAESAQIVGHTFCLTHYATGYVVGTPRRLAQSGKVWWIMPVLLTSPGYGVVGEVGVVAVNARTGKVTGSTPRAEVLTAARRLTEEKRSDLEAAFRRARTDHSTVTLLAKFRGLSTSQPRRTAMW